METKVVFSKLAKYRLILTAFLILGTAAGFFYTLSDKGSYTASIILYLKPQVTSGGSEADYFGQKRVGDFTDTFASLISSEVGQEESGVSFRVRKIAPQLLRISTVSQTEDQARESLMRVVGYSEEKLNELSMPSDNFARLEKTSEDLRVSQRETEPILNLLVGLMLGGLAGLVLVAMREYFSEDGK